MNDKDQYQSFLFDKLAIRGQIVHLDDSFRDCIQRQNYPEKIRESLGQFLAAVTLLSSSLKFEGSLILQAEGEGQVSLMMAECKNRSTIRGVCRYVDSFDPDLALFENAKLALTIEPKKGNAYQSFINLENDDFIKGLEDYFEKSEQIKTAIHLAVNEESASGMMIQAMPLSASEGSLQIEDEDYLRIQYLFKTVKDEELLMLSNHEILHRLFHEENVRVFDAHFVSFECGCSRERGKAAVRSLGLVDAKALISEREQINIDCQFCKQVYFYDVDDLAEIFRHGETLN